MSSGITLSAATRQNLLSLQGTADLLSTTQNRLSTGKKVNTALDSPVNFFTSQSLNTRSGDLSSLLDGISNGVQTIQAANQGITSLSKLTDQLKSVAQQALAATGSFTSKASATATVPGTATADNILGGTPANATVTGNAKNSQLTAAAPITGASKLGGAADTDSVGLSVGDTLTVNGSTITVRAAGTTTTGNDVTVDSTVTDLLGKIDSITGAATASTVSGSTGALTISTGTTSDLTLGGTAATKLGLSSGTTERTKTGALSGTLTVSVGTGADLQSKTLTLGGSNVKTLEQLNTQLSSIGAVGSIDSAGKLNITTSNDSGSKAIALGGAAAAQFSSPTAVALGGDGQTARNKLVNDYNNLLTQIDQQAKDASFNGVNLLNGDNLKVIFNEKNTSSITVQGAALTSASLGLNTLDTNSFKDNDGVNKVIEGIRGATTKLSSQAATYGANLSVVQNRQDFSKNLINILDTGSANLVNADLNEEAANSQALSTRNSLAISALGLANTAQQGILQLLR
jgi:flagellin